MTATLILVRHGETVGQSSVRLYGATDVALSATGVAQIEAVAACLRREPLAALIASPLQRSRVAAEIVAAAQPRPPAITTVAEFAEVDFGAWEGLTFDEVAARDPEGLRRFHAEGLEFTYPGGEQRRHLWARVRSAALRELAPARGHVAAVLHKGVIKAALAALVGLTPEEAAELPVSLGGIYRLERRDGRWDISQRNATAHLGALDLGG